MFKNGELAAPKSLETLRDEATEALGIGARYKITAVGEYADGSRGIASSDPCVPRVQREAMEAQGVREVTGIGHAEETLTTAQLMRLALSFASK